MQFNSTFKHTLKTSFLLLLLHLNTESIHTYYLYTKHSLNQSVSFFTFSENYLKSLNILLPFRLILSLCFGFRLIFGRRGRGNGKIKYICIQMAEINLKTLTAGVSEIDVNFNGTLEGQADATIPLNVNLTDGTNPVTPTSVALTGNDLDITIVPSGVDLRGFPHSTQRLSYRTGDIGWRTQNAWYDYTPPANPAAVSVLDYSSANFWYLLKNNIAVNGVSTKTRFVDVDGVQTFSATGNKNLMVVDKFTGLGIYRGNLSSIYTWNGAIDAADTLSVVINGITYNEWYLISVEEWLKLVYGRGNTGPMIDTVTSVNVLNMPQANYWNSDNFVSLGALNRAYWRDDSGNMFLSNINPGNGYNALFITKQTMNLITAP